MTSRLSGNIALRPAAMANLLGDLWQAGEPNWARMCAYPDVKLHLYGKLAARPGRKMGHLTAVGSSVEDALARARTAAAHVCWADDPVDGGKESER